MLLKKSKNDFYKYSVIKNLNGNNLFEMWGEAPCLDRARHCGELVRSHQNTTDNDDLCSGVLC